MTEQWRTIKEFPEYMISNKGRVWSKTRVIKYSSGKRVFKTGGFKSQHCDKDGYKICGLIKNGEVSNQKVHRLVAKEFLLNEKGQVNHKDGNKSNNNAENLEWCTPSENIKHSYLKLNKKANVTSKLSSKNILEIRELKNDGMKQVEIAKKFKVSPMTISLIIRNKTWKNVTEVKNG